MQPAQPTTVGKRACLWAYDLALDLAEVEHRLATLKARGAKGTTGTQASFLELFDGDHEKVRELERAGVPARWASTRRYAVTGQTYSRKVDAQVLDALVGHRASAHKAATDLRLLAHRKEVEEPFETAADRLLGDGLQAQPDAERADLLAGPVRDEPGSRAPAATHADAVAGAHARRQRQPPAGAAAGASWRPTPC